MKCYRLIALIGLFIISIGTVFSCSDKQEHLGDTGKDDNIDVESVGNIKEIIDFCQELSDNNDYCVSFENKNLLKSKSGKSVKIDGICPVFILESDGILKINNEDTGIILEVEDTWYTAPVSSVDRDGSIVIKGRDTDVMSSGIYAIDCGKFIYFYTAETSVAVPSEIYEPFNPPLPKNKDVLKILFVGNSFNVDATTHLPAMLAAQGVKNVIMGRTHCGSARIAGDDKGYITNYDSPDFCQYVCCDMTKGGNSWPKGDYNSNLKTALNAMDWDIVTFMEYPGHSDLYNGWNSVTSNGEIASDNVKTFIQTVFQEKGAKRPTVIFLMAQANSSQHKIVKENFGGNPALQYNEIAKYGKNLLDDTCVDMIIATGTAIQNLRTTDLNRSLPNGQKADEYKHELSRDSYHLDFGIGRYTASCTIWYNIFEPALGLELKENSFRYDDDNQQTTPVTDSNIDLCRRAARFATIWPFEIINMNDYEL